MWCGFVVGLLDTHTRWKSGEGMKHKEINQGEGKRRCRRSGKKEEGEKKRQGRGQRGVSERGERKGGRRERRRGGKRKGSTREM